MPSKRRRPATTDSPFDEGGIVVLVPPELDEAMPVEEGCGCSTAIGVLAVPLVLEVVALLLMAPGPASGDRWFLKGLLIAFGGLHEAGVAMRLRATARTLGFNATEETVLPGADVTAIGPILVRDGERIVAAGRTGGPFSISTVDELDTLATLRRTLRRLRLAAVLAPLAGGALLLGGFWWILTA